MGFASLYPSYWTLVRYIRLRRSLVRRRSIPPAVQSGLKSSVKSR
jgi:hypothetical protein